MGANAQTSVPAFTAGQVLTAAQVTQIDTGIPVFASSTERDAAFGGTGEKTLAEGQMAYLEDTNETQYYDGSSWSAVGGGGGLVFISRTTIGSAVSSVTVSGAFSADYDNYLVIISDGVASSAQILTLTLSGSGSNYKAQVIYGSYTNATPTGEGGTGRASFSYAGYGTTTHLVGTIFVGTPYLTTRTTFLADYRGTADAGWSGGMLDDATSYTGFTIAPNAGTLTGGTIDVYGYAKA